MLYTIIILKCTETIFNIINSFLHKWLHEGTLFIVIIHIPD